MCRRDSPFSPAAIAIHTPEGRLLDLVWHDGRLTAVDSYPGTSTVVCAGVNSELNVGELGARTEHPEAAPLAVFAYTAQLDRDQGFIANNPDLATIPTLWIYTLLPFQACDTLKSTGSSLQLDTNGPAPLMRVLFDSAYNKNGSVTFYISEDGAWKPGYANDAYRARDDVVPFADLELGEPPPFTTFTP